MAIYIWYLGRRSYELGLSNLLEHRWINTVSFFGEGDKDPTSNKNQATKHNKDYGLFNKAKLQQYWLEQCNKASIKWNTSFEYTKENEEIICGKAMEESIGNWVETYRSPVELNIRMIPITCQC